jgi:hypothetical protein
VPSATRWECGPVRRETRPKTRGPRECVLSPVTMPQGTPDELQGRLHIHSRPAPSCPSPHQRSEEREPHRPPHATTVEALRTSSSPRSRLLRCIKPMRYRPTLLPHARSSGRTERSSMTVQKDCGATSGADPPLAPPRQTHVVIPATKGRPRPRSASPIS